MKYNYDIILDEVFRHEGGYVDNAMDPGGATNMGITRKTLARWRKIVPYTKLPKTEVKNLTKAEAAKIYDKEYWSKVRGDLLPSGIDCSVMDFGVNSGPSRSIKTLQQCLGVSADGVIGPNTLAAVKRADAKQVIQEFNDRRMAFLQGLSTFRTFGNGWTRRVSSVRATSLALVDQKPASEAPSGSGSASTLLAIIIKLILKLIGK